ncbi:hypothetical protein EZ428_06740 [Pedobacter frigiditerrae]|uniref:Alpha/beta hydrolase n=1 Tax=Pedobacter frigiditerrae TaxID=2530452 RepID=A0A4R0N4Z7_9SPHI|nr:hypothetical protein [Pedobacter frigiditerrae]TCC94463.1 hypothetical protein EZ428_06740 [Pedobacter frigiditerrae]
MKNFIFFIAFVLTNSIAFSQLPPKVENDKMFGKGCYYFKQIPKGGSFNNVLVLIPGLGEHPYSVSAQTTILQEAEKNGIAIVIVNLSPNNESLAIDDNSIAKLEKMINHFYEQEKISSTVRLFIGGFSIGGTTALKFYTQKHSKFKIYKIFAIDPPLDMVRLRKSLTKGREKSVIMKLDSINTDKQLPENGLKRLSVYNPDFTITASLPDYNLTALRIYCEPDILWWIKNRNMDLSDMNVTDCAGYINKLLLKNQNQKVELILTQNKGVRNGNQVHPHSWSIAEPIDLIKWLLN